MFALKGFACIFTVLICQKSKWAFGQPMDQKSVFVTSKANVRSAL